MFHFLHLTSLFRSPKRNFAHRRLFLPAWPSRPSTPDEAKAIVTVWNPKRDQLTCPNITGQLAVSSPALRTKTSLLMARPTKVTQTRADLPTLPETGHVNKRLSIGGTVCLQGGQSYASGAASHWPTCLVGGSGCHAEGTSEAAPRSCTQPGYWWHYGWPLGCVLKPSTLYLSYQQRGIALSVLLSGDIVGIKSWVNTLELKVSAVFSNPKAKTSALQSPERWEKKSEDSKVLIFHNGAKKSTFAFHPN